MNRKKLHAMLSVGIVVTTLALVSGLIISPRTLAYAILAIVVAAGLYSIALIAHLLHKRIWPEDFKK